MSNDSVAVAVKVSRGINVLEGHGMALLEEHHRVVGSIIKARETIIAEKGKHQVPVTFGLAALETATEAQNKLSSAIRLVAQAHQHLAADQIDAGITFVSYGDEWPCPTGLASQEQARPALAIVA